MKANFPGNTFYVFRDKHAINPGPKLFWSDWGYLLNNSLNSRELKKIQGFRGSHLEPGLETLVVMLGIFGNSVAWEGPVSLGNTWKLEGIRSPNTHTWALSQLRICRPCPPQKWPSWHKWVGGQGPICKQYFFRK